MALTAAQIVADALAISKCPGYTAQGGRALNLVLNDLVLHRNLKVNLVASTIIVPPNSFGPFPLEANYLRTYDMSYQISGEPYFLIPGSLREYDQEIKQSGQAGYPYEWASDLSAVAGGGLGKFYIYPQANTQLPVQHRYYLSQPDIAQPELSSTIPWFADQDYLIQAVAMRMMRITDDSRYDKYVMDCENLLRTHLLTEGDEWGVVKSVELDPRRFRGGGGNRPTKTDPF